MRYAPAKVGVVRNRALNIRLEPELKRRLVAAAEAERRNLSDLIRIILDDWLKSRGL